MVVVVLGFYVSPTAKGHTETGPRFKVTSERLEKPGIELTTPGSEGKWLNHYTTEASRHLCNHGILTLLCLVLLSRLLMKP